MIRYPRGKSISYHHLRSLSAALCALAGLMAAPNASALELNWSGQFRAEYNFIRNYSMDNTDAGGTFDANRSAAGGYYIGSGGSANATFQTLFLKLQPKLVVNDNVYIKTEWWVGDPVYGLFGNALPYTPDQRQFYSNQSRGSTITAQRYWAEILSDIGTLQVGRAPLHWGLGLVWNNGDGLWDRYHSTGDTVRLVSRFGAFSFIPSYVVYSTGNAVGGAGTFAADGSYTNNFGSGGVTEFTLALKYENLDEDLEGGVNYIKRLAGGAQDPNGGVKGPLGVGSFNYSIWDLYAKKRLGRLILAAEAPITTGFLGVAGPGPGLDYSTFALAGEANLKLTDAWEFQLKAGHAPGQGSGPQRPDSFRAFFFNPAYRLGMLMFNYQFANFRGPNTLNNPATPAASLASPYDNPIVNANYLMLTGMLHAEKWTFDATALYARADKTAQAGSFFYNHTSRGITPTAATSDQGSSLGVETDLGATLHWDEYFLFRFDLGMYFPGSYFKFANLAGVENRTDMVFGASARVGINF